MVFDFIVNLVSSLGYFGIFIAMTIESASIPLPSEIIMGIAGFLAYKGEMSVVGIGLAGALGNICGSTIMYFLGSRGGRPLVDKYGHYFHISNERFNKVETWFAKWGDIVVFASQLLPVVRTFVSLPAGVLKINFPKFILYTFSGALIWCTLLGYISSLLGPEWEKLSDLTHQAEIVMLIAFLLALVLYIVWRIYKHKQKSLNPA